MISYSRRIAAETAATVKVTAITTARWIPTSGLTTCASRTRPQGIAASLADADPAGRSQYEANAVAYAAELDSLHSWIEEQVEIVPAERRLLVSSHDSLRYFAQRYGFTVVGAVKPPSGQEEPTAQELTKLADHIQKEAVPAIFAEDAFSPRLARRIAEETGVLMITDLRTSSLDEPGGPAATYPDFMRHNVGVMVEALK